MARSSRLVCPRYAVPTHLHTARGTITLPYIGRFTWQQFWWLLGTILVAGFPWWLRLPLPVVAVWAGLVGLLGLLCAFVPINTRPFPVWLAVYARYRRRPRRAVWRPTPAAASESGHAAFVRYSPRIQWLGDDGLSGHQASGTVPAAAAPGSR